MQALTDVMVHDIFSPPQASRVYVYATVAGYEAARHDDPRFASYAGQLNGLDAVPEPDGPVDGLLAGTHAFFRVADALVFSRERLAPARDTLLASFDALPEDVRQRSEAYGEAVAAHVLAWAADDGYGRTRSLPRYTPSADAGAWQPTPPAYIEAIEPYWGRLRPFALDSAGAFRAPPPPPFSTDPGSDFYRAMHEVYQVRVDLTDEQRAIASFWDCNPFVLYEEGHLSYAAKKISPGGHWMGIVRIAVERNRDTPVAALAAFSQTAIALADGFIVSWVDKYETNVIRPETIIRRTLDPMWQPVLQTPPFPEYTSGHSVISTAAAEVLTSIYGDRSPSTTTARCRTVCRSARSAPSARPPPRPPSAGSTVASTTAPPSRTGSSRAAPWARPSSPASTSVPSPSPPRIHEQPPILPPSRRARGRGVGTRRLRPRPTRRGAGGRDRHPAHRGLDVEPRARRQRRRVGRALRRRLRARRRRAGRPRDGGGRVESRPSESGASRTETGTSRSTRAS